MEKVTQIITDYIKAGETDYAIMINGDWGSGKTYYVQNTLFNELKKIESPFKHTFKKSKKSSESNFKFYTPVYVSLYGLSRAEDIYTKILHARFPVLQSKITTTVSITANRFFKLFKIDKISEKERKKLESLINITKNTVLFFDDLERISKNLHIQEVLGIINTYTEHQKLKTIIICNDKKVPNEYADFKEKTVRFTCQYKAPIDTVYDSITSNFKSNEYKKFLFDNKNTLIQIFKTTQYSNLRTLRFILEIFQKVFNNTPSGDYKEDILKDLFLFTIMYSIEYKDGVSKEELDSLSKTKTYLFLEVKKTLSIKEKENKKEPEYYEKFCEKYIDIYSSFFYYPIIANYIHLGYLGTKEFNELIVEIGNKVKEEKESEKTLILNKLRDFAYIKEEEFIEFINTILKMVNNNDFSLYDYPSIYAQLIQIEYMKIENFTITENTKESLKKAIEKSKQNHRFNPNFEMSLSQWSNSDKSGCKEKYQEIYDLVIQANEDIGKQEKETKIRSFEEMISQNNAYAVQEYMYNNHNIIKEIDANAIFEKLNLSNGDTIKSFLSGIYTIYPDNYLLSISDNEKRFCKEMISFIDDYYNDESHKRTTKYMFLFRLRNKLDNILKTAS